MFLENFLILILISAIFASIAGVWLLTDNYKKIAALSAAFTGVILLFFTLAFISSKRVEIFSILISLLLIFAATIIIGINLVNKINLEEERN